MFGVIHVVPTGIRASIGGYIGDATPATNLLASIADIVITHPNVVNAAAWDLSKHNVLYVEGFLLDQFSKGKIALRPRRGNKIGVIIDKIDSKTMALVVNTINALESVAGINVLDVKITRKPVNGKVERTKAGAFVGIIPDEDVLLEPAKELVEQGCDVIAVTTRIKIKRSDWVEYISGKIPNPYGGLEALISHIISRETGVPCAHAPILTQKEIVKNMEYGVVDPRGAAEIVTGAGYLGCVLIGLSNAPKPIEVEKARDGDITIDDIKAIIAPYNALGGIPMLAAQKKGIPVIGVRENSTILNVTADKLHFPNYIEAQNYWEAAGILACLKEGIDIQSVRR